MSPKLAGALGALLALFFVVGCDNTPEGRISGAWIVDTQKTQLPHFPIPGIQERIKGAVATTTLKLNSDRTFTFVYGQSIKGVWTLQGQQITLKALDFSKEEPLPEDFQTIKLKLAPNGTTMTLPLRTPIGEATVVLLKSG